MSTKFQNSDEIRKAFQDLLTFKTPEEELDHRAKIIMFRILSEVEELAVNRNMTHKDLAMKIGTSASYITQLYRGNKLLNLFTIAKFEKVFGVTFSIKALPEMISKHQFKIPNHVPKKKTERLHTQLASEPKVKYKKKS
jgi:transcriptional regulator with XRE-family HTH domain